MSARDGYQPGVPCWVAAVEPDPDQASAFYGELFGWETENLMPAHSEAKYFMCRLDGRAVAAVVSEHGAAAPPNPLWATHIWVQSADQAVARAEAAGATVLGSAFDSPAGGRMAVLSDPTGAAFCVWEPGRHRGAEIVNEPRAWAMSELITSDPDRARDFYASVFGWETDTLQMGASEVTLWRVPGYVGGEPEQPVSREVVGVMVAIDDDRSGDRVTAHWGVDFWVNDADATAESAQALGGSILAPPHDEGMFRRAALADPQGASFSISKLLIP
jgi:uncharacterized protein